MISHFWSLSTQRLCYMPTRGNVSKVASCLKEDEFFAVPFDKGLGFCLKRSIYVVKMNNLCDRPLFKYLGENGTTPKYPAICVPGRFKVLVDSMEKKKFLNFDISNAVTVVQKFLNCTVWPKYTKRDSYKANLSVLMSIILDCNIESKRNLVTQQLSQIELPKSIEMISLDVSSLFTMVGVDETTETSARNASELGFLPVWPKQHFEFFYACAWEMYCILVMRSVR